MVMVVVVERRVPTFDTLSLSPIPFHSDACLPRTDCQVIAALENGVSQYPKLDGRFPCVSGLRFSFDPSASPGSQLLSFSFLLSFFFFFFFFYFYFPLSLSLRSLSLSLSLSLSRSLYLCIYLWLSRSLDLSFSLFLAHLLSYACILEHFMISIYSSSNYVDCVLRTLPLVQCASSCRRACGPFVCTSARGAHPCKRGVHHCGDVVSCWRS